MKKKKALTKQERKHLDAIRSLSAQHRAAVFFLAQSFLMAEARTKAAQRTVIKP